MTAAHRTHGNTDQEEYALSHQAKFVANVSPRSSLLAVYEESLKKTKQERARLEQQAKEVQEQLARLGDERAEIQEVVRQLISQFGKGTHIKAANAIATKPREGAVAAVRAEVQALEEIRRSKDSHPTHHSR